MSQGLTEQHSGWKRVGNILHRFIWWWPQKTTRSLPGSVPDAAVSNVAPLSSSSVSNRSKIRPWYPVMMLVAVLCVAALGDLVVRLGSGDSNLSRSFSESNQFDEFFCASVRVVWPLCRRGMFYRARARSRSRSSSRPGSGAMRGSSPRSWTRSGCPGPRGGAGRAPGVCWRTRPTPRRTGCRTQTVDPACVARPAWARISGQGRAAGCRGQGSPT
jgi:hypothetical protein